MPEPRRLGRILLLLLAVLAGGCGRDAVVESTTDAARVVASERKDAAQWIVAGRQGEVTPELAIQLGYLERQRLGLGSPFRLIDQVLRDPRLGDGVRYRTASALLARTLEGQGYQIDPMVLDPVGATGAEWLAGVGRYHLRLIDNVISEAPDPRVGEEAVRLAYALAAAEGSVSGEAPLLIAQAAALIRDRELAREDARRLVRVAQEEGIDPIELVAEWRSERRFEVERPALAPLPAEAEREAIELALRLSRSVQGLGPRLAGHAPPVRGARGGAGSLLGVEAARVLAGVVGSFQAPPRTPVVVAVAARRVEAGVPGLGEGERGAWERFLARARDEEGLVAEYALLLDAVPDAVSSAGGAVLAAAVGMRTYAQERVWFPGFGGPPARELEDRFGLAAVRFDADVPPAWRPYYRGVIADALTDLQRVLPSLNVRGLSFHLGASRGGAATLALHDPVRRTIYLSPETGMGTLAHEVAHDLDWQVALRRFRVRGDYASDRAVRQAGGHLAGALQRLTTTTLRPPVPGDPAPVVHAQRPAEVFARSVDWFVLVSLAREGRSNGYLTSAQDGVLTGYGTVRPPDIAGQSGQALVAILDEIAPVYPATREWFLRRYGQNRTPTAYELVRRLLELEPGAPVGGVAVKAAEPVEGEEGVVPWLGIAGLVAERFRALAAARDIALAAIPAARWCRLAGEEYDAGLGVARRRLIARAAEARGRGVALHYAGALAGEQGRAWLAGRLFGAPWSGGELDSLAVEFLEGLAREVRKLGEAGVVGGDGEVPWMASSDYSPLGWGGTAPCAGQLFGRGGRLYAGDVRAPNDLVQLELKAGR